MIMGKTKVEAIKNLDDSTIYLILPAGGLKPLKIIFNNNSDLVFDIGTMNESLASEGVRIIDVLSRSTGGYKFDNK